jgi:hypothetical protein
LGEILGGLGKVRLGKRGRWEVGKGRYGVSDLGVKEAQEGN